MEIENNRGDQVENNLDQVVQLQSNTVAQTGLDDRHQYNKNLVNDVAIDRPQQSTAALLN